MPTTKQVYELISDQNSEKRSLATYFVWMIEEAREGLAAIDAGDLPSARDAVWDAHGLVAFMLAIIPDADYRQSALAYVRAQTERDRPIWRHTIAELESRVPLSGERLALRFAPAARDQAQAAFDWKADRYKTGERDLPPGLVSEHIEHQSAQLSAPTQLAEPGNESAP